MTEAAKWREVVTTDLDHDSTLITRRLDNAPRGIRVALYGDDDHGGHDVSARMAVYAGQERPRAGAAEEAAESCRVLAARLLEAAEMIAPGTGRPIPV